MFSKNIGRGFVGASIHLYRRMCPERPTNTWTQKNNSFSNYRIEIKRRLKKPLKFVRVFFYLVSKQRDKVELFVS